MRSSFPLTCGVLLLGCLAGFARGGEGAAEELTGGQDMPGTEKKPADGDAKDSAEKPPARESPYLLPGPGAIWDSLVARHEEYAGKVGSEWQPGTIWPLHFVLSGGVYLLQPHLESNPAYTLFRRPGAGGVPAAVSFTPDLKYDTAFAPLAGLGAFLDCGLGLGTRWWHFDEDSALLGAVNTDPTRTTLFRPAPVFGVPGFVSPSAIAQAFRVFNEAMTFQSHLDLHMWDWEVTQRVELGGWTFLPAAGLRYVYLSQNYQALRSGSGTGTFGTARVNLMQDSDLIQTGHNFSGAGPLAALAVRRPLGDSGFTLYGLSRGAVLFGRGRTQSTQLIVQRRQVIPPRGSTQTVNTTTQTFAANGHDDDLPIWDLEAGVEWSHAFGPRWAVFFQTGLVAQMWFNAGNSTSENGDLSFFGLSVTGGVTF
jgi:hypothetical protein